MSKGTQEIAAIAPALRGLLGLLEDAQMLREAGEPCAAGFFKRKFESNASDFIADYGQAILHLLVSDDRPSHTAGEKDV